MARADDAYASLALGERPEAWISVRPHAEARAAAEAVDARVRAGEELPLAGTVVAVKDNIDVAGLPTTAACPGFVHRPAVSAPAVLRLEQAGAVIIGKTNLDQFATGLVGTRSPYGAVPSAGDPERIAGGSSSGSAVAVALGTVDFALGTDTAGSGRVPAALNGIVGLKPTLGLVPVTGVVPAARSYDTVSVLAPDLTLAGRVFAALAGPDPADPRSRPWPLDAPLAAPPRPRVGVPADEHLAALSPGWAAQFCRTVQLLADAGAEPMPVDLSPFLEAGRLLYGGALIAERYAAFGAVLEADPAGADPVVRQITLAARDIPAHELVRDLERLDFLRRRARDVLAGVDALLVPTTTHHPTLDEVAADPVGVNTQLGTYTTFANLLDLSAVAVPAGQADGGPFGVTVLAPAFADRVALDVAALVTGTDPATTATTGRQPATPLVVLGAHLSGQPLNHQLVARGGRYHGPVTTASAYRLHALPGSPPKPGLVPVRDGGGPVTGELWSLPPAGLGSLLAELPEPMSLGPVRLADGRTAPGFLCSAAATATAPDITHFGGWRAYLAAQPTG